MATASIYGFIVSLSLVPIAIYDHLYRNYNPNNEGTLIFFSGLLAFSAFISGALFWKVIMSRCENVFLAPFFTGLLCAIFSHYLLCMIMALLKEGFKLSHLWNCLALSFISMLIFGGWFIALWSMASAFIMKIILR
jgi:hypothetical protein